MKQEHALPILAEIRAWLRQHCTQVLPKSAIGKAIGYMLGQWSKLEAYMRDGRLEIDNNLVENAIRPVALGRKNYLFAGSHVEDPACGEGAKRAAIIYSLVATAKRHEVEPFAYIKDVLTRIPDHPPTNSPTAPGKLGKPSRIVKTIHFPILIWVHRGDTLISRRR